MVSYFNGVFISFITLSWIKFTHSADWQTNFTVMNVVCSSGICYDYAHYVNKNMNRKADPCSDFYEFACGNKKNILAPYYPTWSTAVEMSMNSAKLIRNFLQEEPGKDDSLGLLKAKTLYRACMKLPHVSMLKSHEVQNYIQDSFYFPLFSDARSGSQKRKSWLEIHKYYFDLTSDAGIYEVFVDGDEHNDFVPLLNLVPVQSPFGRIVFSTTLKGTRKKVYEKYLKALLFSVFSYNLLKVSPKILKGRIEAVVTFRCEIQAIKDLYSNGLKPPHNYHVKTIGELEYWYQEISKDYPSAEVPWVEVIHSLYGKRKSENTIRDMKINVPMESYHKMLVGLIHNTPNDVLVNHMHLYFIEKHLDHSPLLKEMLMEVTLHEGKLAGSIKYPGKKWHVCILTNSMNEAIGKTYVQKYFPQVKKKVVEKYVTEIKDVLAMKIYDSNWLDANTMARFTHIIEEMKIDVGYPAFYDDETVRHGYSPLIDPGNVEAYYCPNQNRLSMSAAMFQLPLYDPQLPNTILYGSAGMMISHELHHAFSPSVIPQCYTFNIPRSKKFLFDEKIKCFKKKYDKVPVRELKHLKPIPTIDGSRTLDENIADAMGLKIAYEAFRKNGWENGQCAVVPIYRGVTCEQLFFIAFATIFCSDMEPDLMIDEILNEDHSTNRVRVNEAVSNMKDFSRVFDCPKKAPMNSNNRCDLWEQH